MIKVIDAEAMPTLKRCSLAGHAELKTHNQLFNEHSLAADMLMDILTDRGFATAYDVIEQVVPARVNLQTGEIENRYEYLHHFRSAAPLAPPTHLLHCQNRKGCTPLTSASRTAGRRVLLDK